VKTLVVVPIEKVSGVGVLEHLLNQSGHMALEKTIDRVKERAWWPGYTRTTEEWIAKCPVCARKGRLVPHPKAQVQSILWKGPYRVLKCYDNATSKLNRFKEAEHSACTMTGSNLVHSVLLRKLEVSLSHNPLGVNWTKQQKTPRQQNTSKERRRRCPEAVQRELEAHHVG
jgi:hypothetical protein